MRLLAIVQSVTHFDTEDVGDKANETKLTLRETLRHAARQLETRFHLGRPPSAALSAPIRSHSPARQKSVFDVNVRLKLPVEVNVEKELHGSGGDPSPIAAETPIDLQPTGGTIANDGRAAAPPSFSASPRVESQPSRSNACALQPTPTPTPTLAARPVPHPPREAPPLKKGSHRHRHSHSHFRSRLSPDISDHHCEETTAEVSEQSDAKFSPNSKGGNDGGLPTPTVATGSSSSSGSRSRSSGSSSSGSGVVMVMAPHANDTDMDMDMDGTALKERTRQPPEAASDDDLTASSAATPATTTHMTSSANKLSVLSCCLEADSDPKRRGTATTTTTSSTTTTTSSSTSSIAGVLPAPPTCVRGDQAKAVPAGGRGLSRHALLAQRIHQFQPSTSTSSTSSTSTSATASRGRGGRGEDHSFLGVGV